jgi:hypothetical protein
MTSFDFTVTGVVNHAQDEDHAREILFARIMAGARSFDASSVEFNTRSIELEEIGGVCIRCHGRISPAQRDGVAGPCELCGQGVPS